MSFHKQPIHTNCHTSLCHSFNKLRHTSCHSRSLIRLLQRMCHIQHYRMSERLHFRNSSIIDNQILITKHCTTFRQHHLIITCLYDFISSKTHGSRRQELSFLNIDNSSGASCRNQQIGLATKECRYLQHIHILSSHFCFGSGMNICYDRHIKRASYLSQDFQRLFIPYSSERIQT